MPRQLFKIRNKVWRWPGVGGWHFVYVDKGLSQKIKKIAAPFRYGSGFVAIRATIGKTSWDTALFPYEKEDVYLISIKTLVRKKENIFEGDMASIIFRFRRSSSG